MYTSSVRADELHAWVAARGKCVGTMLTANAGGDDPWYEKHAFRGRYSVEVQARRARSACEGCLARKACLELALRYERAEGWSWGYWGGTAPGERKRIIAQREHRDDVATNVLLVLSSWFGSEVDLTMLPAPVQGHLIVLGLALVYWMRDDEYLLRFREVFLKQVLVHRGPARPRRGRHEGLAPVA